MTHFRAVVSKVLRIRVLKCTFSFLNYSVSITDFCHLTPLTVSLFGLYVEIKTVYLGDVGL